MKIMLDKSPMIDIDKKTLKDFTKDFRDIVKLKKILKPDEWSDDVFGVLTKSIKAGQGSVTIPVFDGIREKRVITVSGFKEVKG